LDCSHPTLKVIPRQWRLKLHLLLSGKETGVRATGLRRKSGLSQPAVRLAAREEVGKEERLGLLVR